MRNPDDDGEYQIGEPPDLTSRLPSLPDGDSTPRPPRARRRWAPAHIHYEYIGEFTCHDAACAPPPVVVRPDEICPGTLAARILSALLPAKAFAQWILPAISDMGAEHEEELLAGRPWRAAWVVMRGHLTLLPRALWALCPRAIHRLI